jgi:hypothetical protein
MENLQEREKQREVEIFFILPPRENFCSLTWPYFLPIFSCVLYLYMCSTADTRFFLTCINMYQYLIICYKHFP